MRIRDRLSALQRVQRTTRFKVVASACIVAATVGLIAWWAVFVNAPAGRERRAQAVAALEQERALTPEERIDADRIIASLQTRSAAPTVGLALAAGAGVALGVVWLGLGLSCLALLAAGAAVVGPLWALEATRWLAMLLAGCAALTLAFSVIMRALRLALGRGGPALAVAQTVLSEAVRMKISVVFIVMLVFLLACLPMLLDEDALLRYRVQSFLQYAVGGSFWTLALLTLFFSVGTVAFEQRDRIIWQTMSKPISPLGYLAGKWVGVMALNAALLAVSATGVFLFTEHLRQQPAEGERVPFVNSDGSLEWTADRRLLESQVLVARRGVRPTLEGPNPEELLAVVQRRLDEAVDRDPSLRGSPALAALAEEFHAEEYKEFLRQQRTIEPMQGKRFVFEGLGSFAAGARRMAEAGWEPHARTVRT